MKEGGQAQVSKQVKVRDRLLISLVRPSVMCRNPDGQRGRVVKRLKEGGPAHQSKQVKVGDRLLAVDEVLVSDDLSGEELAGLILGRKGSSCVLRILKGKGGGEVHVTLERFESADEGKVSGESARVYV